MKKLTFLILLGSLTLWGCQPKTDSTPPAPVTVEASESPAAPVAQTPPESTSTPGSNTDSLTPTSMLGDLTAPLSEGVSLTSDHTGKADSAFAFSGEKSGVESPVTINPDAVPVCTLVTWAKFTGDPSAETLQGIVSHDDGEFDRTIGLDNRAGKWGWSCFAGNQGVTGGFPVEPNKWTFLAAVYDQPAKRVTFYAGDEKVEVSDVEMGSGLNLTKVGANPSFPEHFVGEIEPVKVFPRALSEAEIQALKGR